jgi:hypothetical protein
MSEVFGYPNSQPLDFWLELCYAISILKKDMKNVPNWVHNSGKNKRTKGCSKGKLKARKQALKALLNKIGAAQ